MSRRFISRFSSFGFLAFTAAAASVFGTGSVARGGTVQYYQYHPVGTFNLPIDPYGNTVALGALPSGQLMTLNESQVSVETGVGTGIFSVSGSLPAGFSPSYGPSFIAGSPTGQAAAGDGNGDIAVFNPLNPANAATTIIYTLPSGASDYDGRWFNSSTLAVTDTIPNASYTVFLGEVDILNTATGKFTTVVNDIQNDASGIAFDAAGNMYVGDGYSNNSPLTKDGLIAEFSKAKWQSALASGTPLDYSAGDPVAQLLAGDSLDFDGSGNLSVGGADDYGGTGDYGYSSLVSSSLIASAIGQQNTTPPIHAGMIGVNDYTNPYDTGPSGSPNPGIWTYDAATGDYYLQYTGYGAPTYVTTYSAVPEPASLGMLGIGGGMLLLRRRRRRAVAACAIAGACASAVILPNTADAQYNPNFFATSVVNSTITGGNPAYSNPDAILGQPPITFNNSSNPNVIASDSVKIVEPPVNEDLNGNPVLTELPAGTEVTVQMGMPITHDPGHPYGDDLIVYGNSFYQTGGTVSDASNLSTVTIAGGIYGHPVQVSVSPDGVNWFSFPLTPILQPYNALMWDDAAEATSQQELNPTLPLNPSVYSTDFTGATVSQVLDAYGESAGGTAFNLMDAVDASGNTLFQDGYSSIDYVQVAAPSGAYSVISGIAAVQDPPTAAAFVPEPGNLAAIAVGGLSLLRRPRG